MIQRDIDAGGNAGGYKSKNNNLINVIYPYRTEQGHWAYDDEFVTGEPFVMGSSEMIDFLVGADCDKFQAIISAKPLPISDKNVINIMLDNIDEFMENEMSMIQGWYQLRGTDIEHWLCGHLLDWFVDYPKTIFVNIKI